MRRRSCLVLTDVFPPLSAVGVHRTVALCRHLAEQGWGVTVITARPGADARLDEGLLDGVPEEVQVVRTAAPDLPKLAARIFKRRSGTSDSSEQVGITPKSGEIEKPKPGRFRRMVDWLSWWLHIPDSSTGWLIPAVLAGLREARRHRPEVIYSSAPRWTSHLAAGVLSRLLRVPWVADFRDPWCGNPWREIPYRIHMRFDAFLERWVVRNASSVTCATEPIRRMLQTRYPRMTRHIHLIHNGFDPEQIDPVAPVSLDSSRCVLLHTGTLYGPRSPVPLLEGLRRFREESPAEAGRLLVVFLGLPEYNGRPMEDIAREYGVDNLVRLIPPVPHRQALAYLKGADVSVLFGQGGKVSMAPVPAKVYEYIGAGKSVLAIGAGEEALDIMRRGGCRLWCASDRDQGAVAAALKNITDEYSRNNRLIRHSDSDARLAFTRSGMAERLELVMREAIDVRRRM